MANYPSELTGDQIESALNAVSGLIGQQHNGKIIVVENGHLAAKSAIEIQGGTIDPLTITANGTYTHAQGGGYSPIIVNVSGGSETISDVSITLGQNVSTSGSNLALTKSSSGIFGSITLIATSAIQIGDTLCTINASHDFSGTGYKLYDYTPYINNPYFSFTSTSGVIKSNTSFSSGDFITLVFGNYIGNGDSVSFSAQTYVNIDHLLIKEIGNYIYLRGYITLGESGSFGQDNWIPLFSLNDFSSLTSDIKGNPLIEYNTSNIYHRDSQFNNGIFRIWTKGNREYLGKIPFNYFVRKQ